MILVDTYNLLHAIEGLGPEAANLDVRSLGKLISTSRYAGSQCRLVCDGNRGTNGPIADAPNVQAVYAGAGKDADSLIEHFIATSSSARRMLVVSSDRRIQRAAEKSRAKWLDSPSFLSQILKDDSSPQSDRPSFTREEEHEIMRAFGVEPADIQAERRNKDAESTGDPTLDEAIRHFGERLDPEELDMTKWINDEKT